MHVTRREWVLAVACWAELLRAQSAEERYVWFDAATAAEIKAMAARIIPEDDTPGAESAGVIWFIDRALAGYDQDKQSLYRSGLAEAQAKRTELFPGSASIASLSVDQQIALLTAIEKAEFFQQVRLHTIMGFLSDPLHGGNRGGVGWKLMGSGHEMHYDPPFGFYDANGSA